MRSKPSRAALAAALYPAVVGLLAGAVFLFSRDARAAPLAGAIFTTTPDGVIVNENVHYDDKREVYLDGGPGPNAPSDAAGLPDGEYVFQVTDPSGVILLAEDASKCRIVRVTGGIIVALLDWDGSGISAGDFAVHNPGVANDDGCHRDGQANGRHDTNNDVDDGPNDIVVQLMPFFNTPNPGGVYKAWIMPVTRYVANNGGSESSLNGIPTPVCSRNGRLTNNCNGSGSVQIGFARDGGFGPSRDQVKTDNFKVQEFFPPEIKVRKFNDLNGDGRWQQSDANAEPEIGVDQCVDSGGQIAGCPGGWLVFVTDPTSVTNTLFTPILITAAPAGTYIIDEATFSAKNWQQTVVTVDGVSQKGKVNQVSVTVNGSSGETHEVIFGNARLKETPTATNTLPTATRTPTSTPTDTPTRTATHTRTATQTPTETPSNTRTPTGTPTLTPATPTDTPTNTVNPTHTPTDTPTNTPTSTQTATSTPTRTRTPTPTATETPQVATRTATATPTGPTPTQGKPSNLKLPRLQNLFLTQQGIKLAPRTCAQSTDAAVFLHQLSNAPTTVNKYGEVQRVGAFEFEVRFDNKFVCVNLEPGQYAIDTGMTCFILDKDSSLLQGIARMGCAVKGKELPPSSSLELARVIVRPQPEAYQLIKPGQDNGITVQVLNQNCALADTQGEPIAKVGCDDSDLTLRFLEGDVASDCQVDVLDQQQLAMRWMTVVGNGLYNSRMDLQPSGQGAGQGNGDGDIDINDVQFVFARHGSSCTNPWPPQPPRQLK